MIQADYHVHTLESKDCKAPVADMCKRADALKLREICFTNHFDFDEIASKKKYVSITLKELDEFVKKLDVMRDNFKVKIKLGIEVDYRDEYEKETDKFLDDYEFDFVMGAIHWLNNMEITNSELSGRFFRTVDTPKAYALYFKRLNQAIESDLFDVIAHIDTIKKFTGVFVQAYPFEKYRKMAEKSVRLLADTGTGIELNTSGYDNPAKDAYPSLEFVKLCKSMGVKIITAGSDSHRPDQLCRYFDKAEERLKNAGYRQVCLFEKRKPRFVGL